MAKAVRSALPHHPLLYFGDTARTPYGTKSNDVIIDYSLQNAEFLIKNGATTIVVGCNSASSVATEKLRNTFHVPVYEVIGPAARKAVLTTKTGKIGVIGTRATVESRIYEKMIEKLNERFSVFATSCPLLVPLAEESWFNKRETKMIIRRYLQPLKHKQIDTLILGCTHYPLMKNLIQHRIGREVTLIDSSREIAQCLKEDGSIPCPINTAPLTQLYFSDITASAQNLVASIFGSTMELHTP